MKILITGGAGFIGCNFVRYLLRDPKSDIVVLDKLTYAGRLENLRESIDKIKFIEGDICDEKTVTAAMDGCDVIFNFAAETHVDRSINDAGTFVKTNVLGTFNLLECAKNTDMKKFIQISTDEVYGSIDKGQFYETSILDPSSPYSASKAGAELIARAYYKTYGLPILITRSSNNFGPYQYPEKLIPVLILNALRNKVLPIYGSGENVRDWIYVMDHCSAIDVVSKKGMIGEVYNIGGGNEKTNLEIARIILEELNKSDSLIRFISDRPGHDFRYSLNCDKLKNLGWKPEYKLRDALRETINWYS